MNQPQDLAALISAAEERMTWVEYKGVRFQVRYLNRQALTTIGEQCAGLVFDPAMKGRVRKLDTIKFSKMLASALVVDWANCTPRTLQALMPLGVKGLSAEELDKPFPFNEDNLRLVFSNANGLDEFLQEIAVDADNFRVIPEAELEKNSESSLSGT